MTFRCIYQDLIKFSELIEHNEPCQQILISHVTPQNVVDNIPKFEVYTMRYSRYAEFGPLRVIGHAVTFLLSSHVSRRSGVTSSRWLSF